MFFRSRSLGTWATLLAASALSACGWVDSTGRQINQPLNVDLRLGDQTITIDKQTALYRAQLFEQNTYQLRVSDDSPISTFEYTLEQADASQQCLDQGYELPPSQMVFTLPEACGADQPDCQISLAQSTETPTQIDIQVPELYAHYGALYRLSVTNQDNENIDTQFLMCFTAVNQAPVVNNVQNSVSEGGQTTLDPLGVASDDAFIGNQALSLSLQGGEGMPLLSAAQGQVSIEDGQLVYRHDGSQGSPQDSFQFVVNDGIASSIAQATINIGFDNDDPVAVDDVLQPAILEGGTQAFTDATQSVLFNDSDEETPHSALVAEIVNQPQRAAQFDFAPNTGLFTYTHDGSETTEDQFTYRVFDGQVYSNVATVRLSITPVNDAPVITNTQAINASAGLAFFYRLNATDAESDPVTLTLGSGVLPLGMSFNNGTFTGTPNTGSEGRYDLQVVATDRRGASATANITLTVNANSPPTIGTVAVPNAITGQSYSASVSANDPDGDNSAIRYSLSNAPSWLSIQQNSGTLSGTPIAAGVERFTVIAIDSVGLSATKDFTINVRSAPVIATDALPDGQVDVPYSASVSASDPDNSGALRYSLSGPAWASINAQTGAISGTPDNAGLIQITVTTTDDDQLSDSRIYNVNIAPPDNTPPSIQTTSLPAATVGSAYNATLLASDAEGDTITFSSTSVPSGLQLSLEGALSGTPDTAGDFTITIFADDGRDTSQVSLPLSIQAAANSAPVIQTDAALPAATVGSVYAASIVATDAEGAALSFSSVDLPAWLALDTTNGNLSGTPLAAASESFSVSVSDGEASAERSFTLEVTAPAIEPVAVANGGGVGLRNLSVASPSLCWAVRADQLNHTHLPRPDNRVAAQYLLSQLPAQGEVVEFRERSGSLLYRAPALAAGTLRQSLSYSELSGSGQQQWQDLQLVTSPEVILLNAAAFETPLAQTFGQLETYWHIRQGHLGAQLANTPSHASITQLADPTQLQALMAEAYAWASSQGREAYVLAVILPLRADQTASSAEVSAFNQQQNALQVQLYFGEPDHALAQQLAERWLAHTPLSQQFCP